MSNSVWIKQPGQQGPSGTNNGVVGMTNPKYSSTASRNANNARRGAGIIRVTGFEQDKQYAQQRYHQDPSQRGDYFNQVSTATYGRGHLGTWDRASYIKKQSKHAPIGMQDVVFDFAEDVMPVYRKALMASENHGKIASEERGGGSDGQTRKKVLRKTKSMNVSGNTNVGAVGYPQQQSMIIAQSNNGLQHSQHYGTLQGNPSNASGAFNQHLRDFGSGVGGETPSSPTPPAATMGGAAYRGMLGQVNTGIIPPAGSPPGSPRTPGSPTMPNTPRSLKPPTGTLPPGQEFVNSVVKGSMVHTSGFVVDPNLKGGNFTTWDDGANEDNGFGAPLRNADGQPLEDDGSGDEGEIAMKQLRTKMLLEDQSSVVVSREDIAKSLVGEQDPLKKKHIPSRSVLTHDAHGNRLSDAIVGRPTFTMEQLPLHPTEEAMAEQDRREQRSWRWQWHLENGHEIPLTLLLLRGVKPAAHADIVSYHMHPDLLRDVSELQKGSYLAKFPRKGGASHERFFSISMIPPSPRKPPVPMLVWKLHANAHTNMDRIPLSGLVGVSFDSESHTFNHFKVLSNGTALVDYFVKQRERYVQDVWAWQQRTVNIPPEEREPEPEFRPHMPPATDVFLKGPVVGGGKHQYLYVRNAFTMWFLDRRTMTPGCIDVCAYDRPTASLWVSVLRSLCAINSTVIKSKEAFSDENIEHLEEPELENQQELLAWVKKELHRWEVEGDPLMSGIKF